MSQADVSYSCGSCGYPLSLTSSDRITSNIGSEYHKSIKKGFISFLSVDLSRFTQVDETVKISCCKKINGIGLTGCSPTLAYLDADFCNLKPNGIVGIVSGGGLEYLNVSHISHCIPEDGLAVIGSGFATRLKILYLWNCKTVGDKSIMAIAKGCPLLQEWNLGSCDAVKISGWKSIGSNCNKLEKLHVDRCQNLCDDGLQALREGCKRLSVLYISKHCRQFSSTALEEFKLYRNNVDIREQKLTIQM
ncbi:hypothetical protein GH714_029464 [Hevea brasiliensis]|uniref:Uncharacterized protein n=1 Tax=Hevea brasiliensis TaxID=3981 RepID=A0A6A6K9M2_HEVBR|nr:hypothetical protein GH714_029464 [Hevea brasiliensis]